MIKFGTKYSQPLFEGEGGGAPGDAAAVAAAAAAAAAAKVISDKAAADAAAAAKVAADKVIADKVAADAAEAARLAAAGGGLSDDAAKLLKENMKQKKLLEENAAKLKEFEGIDVAAVRKLLADKVEAEKLEAEKKGEWDRLKKMMADEHTTALKKAMDELAAERSAKSQADGKINDLTIGSAFSSSEFVTKETVLPPSKARAIYGAHFEIEGAQIVAFDKPKGAEARTKLVDGAGQPLSFEAAVKKIVESDPDHASIRRSKLANGAGSITDSTTKGGATGAGGGAGAAGPTGSARILAILDARKKKA